MNHNYDTLSEAIDGLKREGYTEDFNLKENCIHCGALGKDILPEHFMIDEVYRFEGMSNPDDSSVVYAISSEKHGLKGILVDAYGVYSSPLSAQMLKKLKFRPG